MIRKLPNEEFWPLLFDFKRKKNYTLSNYGRIVSYTEIFQDGELVNCTRTDGLKVYIVFKQFVGKRSFIRINIAKKVAEYFVDGYSNENCHIIHLDHDKSNDYYKNLKWVSWKEYNDYQKSNPKVIAGRNVTQIKRLNNYGQKLTSTDVIHIKKRILSNNGKTRDKMIAKQFGISAWTYSRIKTGKNWSHIQV